MDEWKERWKNKGQVEQTMDKWNKQWTGGTTIIQMEQKMYGWTDEQINWQDVIKKKEHQNEHDR